VDQCRLTERGHHSHLRLLTPCHLLLQRHLATLSLHPPQLAQFFEFLRHLLGDDKCGLRVSCLAFTLRSVAAASCINTTDSKSAAHSDAENCERIPSSAVAGHPPCTHS
jgi:hypothetical protein